MTYDGVESMNFAYWSSCAFTDSSTRAWMVTDFGCLGGALMIAMLSFGSLHATVASSGLNRRTHLGRYSLKRDESTVAFESGQ